jgi:hypothetical protein
MEFEPQKRVTCVNSSLSDTAPLEKPTAAAKYRLAYTHDPD